MLGIVLLSQGCNARMGDSLMLVVARTAALHSPDNPYKGVWAISGLGPSFVSLFLSSATQSVAGGPLACPLPRALFEWYICSYAGSSGVLVLIFSFFQPRHKLASDGTDNHLLLWDLSLGGLERL